MTKAKTSKINLLPKWLVVMQKAFKHSAVDTKTGIAVNKSPSCGRFQVIRFLHKVPELASKQG